MAATIGPHPLTTCVTLKNYNYHENTHELVGHHGLMVLGGAHSLELRQSQ